MFAVLGPPEQTGQIRLGRSKYLLDFQKHPLPSHVVWVYWSLNLEPVAYGRRCRTAVSEHAVGELANVIFSMRR